MFIYENIFIVIKDMTIMIIHMDQVFEDNKKLPINQSIIYSFIANHTYV